jgi:LysM repeat protein
MRKLLTLLIAVGMLLSLQVSFVGAQDTHEVQAGETAESIAEAYGVTVKALLAANDLRSPDEVVEGMSLEIPSADPVADQPPAEERGDEPAADEPAGEPADAPADEPAAEERGDEPADEPAEEPAGKPDERSGEPSTKPADEVVTPDDIGVAAWIQPGNGSTDVFVQNADANTGNPAVDAIAEYIGPGCSAGACTATKNIAPLASQPFLASAAPVGDGWQGSMIVSSGGGALAVAQTNWSGGNRYGAYTGFNEGCTDVYLPILFKLDNLQNSGFAVQNTTTSDGVPITINLYDGATGALDHQIFDTLNAGEEKYYSVTDYPEIGFQGGSAHITSPQKIAAVADTHWGGVNPDYSGMYSGFCSGQTTLNQPVQYRLHKDGGWWTFSAIIIQNTSDQVANVTLRYYNGVTGAQDMQFTAQINPNASRGFNTMNGGTVDKSVFDPLVGTGTSSAPWWGGSVVISSDVPIVGVGNTLWFAEQKSAQFGLAGANESANALYFPLMQRSGGSWSNWSAALIQNLSTTDAASVNLYFYDRSGNLDLTLPNEIIQPSSGRGFNTRTGGTVPATTFDPLGDNWVGSLYVTSGQPVIGSAQMIFGSDSSAYNAMIAP